MKMFTQIFFIALFALAFALSQKNGDEGLPYEFGFTIDGEQHRHEKKDVRGIIEGEFGFITADGIYHVTVYATDENGKFKILSMKNLRISAPLDGSPLRGELSPEAEKYRKKAGLSPLPQAAAPAQLKPNPLAVPQSVPAQQIVVTTPKSEGPFKFTTQPTVKPACASCGFITTPEPKPFEFQNPIFQKQDQEKQQQSGQSGALPDGPLSVPIPIAPFGSSGGVQNRFEDGRDQSQGQVQSIVGQQSPQLPGSNLPAYQPANGPQNTNYHSSGNTLTNQRPSGLSEGSQHSGGGSQGAQYSSGGTQDSQYPIGGSQVAKPSKEAQGAQYPSGNQKVQYPSIGVGGTQYPSGGQSQGAQYPEYSGAGGGQNNIDGTNSNSGFGGSNPIVGSGSGSYGDDNDKGSFGSSGPVGGSGTNGFGGSIGGSRPSYQQGGTLPNALQTPQRIPPTEVSNFPPTAVSDGVIHVGGKNKQDIPIKNKYPGMQDGLPAGIEEKDITDLLYKFHYTVGFHGHYEKGLKNGAKVGGYFVNGRDGISRVVTYVADENGYRPKVKFINLGLSSDETPKAETEKTFGLKSFEFVWYPVD